MALNRCFCESGILATIYCVDKRIQYGFLSGSGTRRNINAYSAISNQILVPSWLQDEKGVARSCNRLVVFCLSESHSNQCSVALLISSFVLGTK